MKLGIVQSSIDQVSADSENDAWKEQKKLAGVFYFCGVYFVNNAAHTRTILSTSEVLMK